MTRRIKLRKTKPLEFLKTMFLIVSLYMLSALYFETTIYFDHDMDCSPENKHLNINSAPNLTLVTAYFDIGSFRKTFLVSFKRETYMHWIRAYRYVVNPLIIFTDSDNFAKYAASVRKHLKNITKIIKIDCKKLWSFKINHRIRMIFSQPNYPHFYPNTVNPNYSSVQHSKYELVSKAIEKKLFSNEFYAWIDVGYFREYKYSKSYFEIIPPKDFDKSKIAVNQIFKFDSDLTPSEIFLENHVWVGGGMLIGTPNILKQFEQIYKRAVFYFLDKKLMNTDQQLIYAMYHKDLISVINNTIALQVYIPANYKGNPWFFLGNLCRVVTKTCTGKRV